jgi:hypothetical protein
MFLSLQAFDNECDANELLKQCSQLAFSHRYFTGLEQYPHQFPLFTLDNAISKV